MKGNIRSLLFVPAEERKLNKIGTINTDAYIIDLEDSIADAEKDEALNRTINAIKKESSLDIFVRINKNRQELEMNALSQYSVGIVLPKIVKASDYEKISGLLSEKNVIALIESPLALINAKEIAAISWIDALAFGAEDFTVSSNMLNTYDNLYVPKSLISIAAKAYDKKVFDTPCFNLDKNEVLKEEISQALNLGYDGKMAIHPKQVGIINNAFSTFDEIAIKKIIDIYERSNESVCEIEGTVYEKFHIDRLKRMLLSDNEKKRYENES